MINHFAKILFHTKSPKIVEGKIGVRIGMPLPSAEIIPVERFTIVFRNWRVFPR